MGIFISESLKELGVSSVNEVIELMDGEVYSKNPFTKQDDKVIYVYGETAEELAKKLGTQLDLMEVLSNQVGYGMPNFYKIVDNDGNILLYYAVCTDIKDIVILETDDDSDYVWVEGCNPIVFAYIGIDGKALQTNHIGFKQIISYVNSKRNEGK